MLPAFRAILDFFVKLYTAQKKRRDRGAFREKAGKVWILLHSLALLLCCDTILIRFVGACQQRPGDGLDTDGRRYY